MNNQPFLETETEEEAQENTTFNPMLPPANPIISKQFSSINERVSIKIDSSSLSHEDSNSMKYRNAKIEK